MEPAQRELKTARVVRTLSAVIAAAVGALGLAYGLGGGGGPVPVATGVLFVAVAAFVALAGRSERLDRALGFGIVALMLLMLVVAALTSLP
ncbi:MAG: hypothetical protein Kow0062_12540 [Acidobacteriota bacterium]